MEAAMASRTVRRVLILTICAGALTHATVATAQEIVPDTGPVLLQIVGSAESLRGFDAPAAEQSAIRRQVDRITRGVAALGVVLRSARVTGAFHRTLEQDARALDRLKTGRPDARDVIDTTTAVADDIEIKVRYGVQPDGQVPDAKVVARTRSAIKEEPNYRVWYVLRGLAKDPKEHSTFPRLSTPTEHELPPGAYLMWTKAPQGGPEGERTPVDVGKSKPNLVDLPIPASR
jgi:hypothetical protein